MRNILLVLYLLLAVLGFTLVILGSGEQANNMLIPYLGENYILISVIVSALCTGLAFIEIQLRMAAREFIHHDASELYIRLKDIPYFKCLEKSNDDKNAKGVFDIINDTVQALGKDDHLFTTSTFYPPEEYEKKLIQKIWGLHKVAKNDKILLTRIICQNPSTETWIEEIRNPRKDHYKTLAKLIAHKKARIYLFPGYIGLDFILIENSTAPKKVVVGVKESHPKQYSVFGLGSSGVLKKGKTYLFEENNAFVTSLHNYLHYFLKPLVEDNELIPENSEDG